MVVYSKPKNGDHIRPHPRGRRWIGAKKMVYELKPKFANVKSFYGKAQIEECEESGTTALRLYSYSKLVCVVNTTTKKTKFFEAFDFSNTTRRHVYEFLRQTGSAYSGWNSKKIRQCCGVAL